MDLPYPSNPDFELQSTSRRHNSLNVKDSLKLLPVSAILTQSHKRNIVSHIENDDAARLAQYIEKEAISRYAEVGTKGGAENMLHLSAKVDAFECVDFLLKSQYQYFPQEYELYVNSKTAEGLTAVMISIANFSNNALTLLLSYGGIDLFAIDRNKITAYQTAINCKNQFAIKLLMGYECKSKRKQIVNQQKLSEPIKLQKVNMPCCLKIYYFLLECVTCGAYKGEKKRDMRKNSKISKKRTSLLNIQNYFIDYVQLGKFTQDYAEDIEWRYASDDMTNKIGVLFDNFSPFDMCEKNAKIKNLLIIFQSLSQHSWLLRKLIHADRAHPNFYIISLFVDHIPKSLSVDFNIPYLISKNEPLFLSDKKQMWPPLLQKGLAKSCGSYSQIENLDVPELMGMLSGFPTARKQLELMKNPINFMQAANEKGYFYVLEGKKDSYLCDVEGNVHCFTILNFYNKGDKKLILVNCPFVDEAWLQKQKYEMLALKVIKTHYNSPNQMCIWIQQDKIKQYFSSIIISTIIPHYERTVISIKAQSRVFFKFTIIQGKEDCIIFQLIDLNNKETISMSSLEGWMDEGYEKIGKGVPNFCMEDLAHINSEPGEYFCKLELDQSNHSMKKLLLIAWSNDCITPQCVEESFGIIDWLSYCRNYAFKNWKDEAYKIEEVGNVSVVIIRATDSKKAYLVMNAEPANVLQGKCLKDGRIEMIKQKGVFFCVIKARLKGQSIDFCFQ